MHNCYLVLKKLPVAKMTGEAPVAVEMRGEEMAKEMA